MMIAMTSAALVGISTACGAWVLVRWRQNSKDLSSRLAGSADDMAFPYDVYAKDSIKADQKSLRLEDISRHDTKRISKDLFLAGFRQSKNVQFFSFLLKLSFILPVFIVGAHVLKGDATLKNSMGAVLLGILFYIGVHLFARYLKKKRQHRILKAMPQLVDLLVVCVESGLSFTASLERILAESDEKEPLYKEFGVMHQEYLSGMSFPQTCKRLDQRCGVPDLSVVLSSIIQSDQMGSSLGHVLRVQAGEVRDKLRQRARTKAYQITVKLLFPMMLIFIAFVLLNLGYIGFQMGAVIGGGR